ncbi:hypothetical protein C8R46DRAFT_1351891 [Mycena filopes]|nr:hypothetical protein C8R46DRAFT_1351891 [Mycena filopes]
MIGPDLQGLAIFGSITKKYVLRAAHTLADASGYPVIVQPRSDDPLLIWATSVPSGSDGEQSNRPTAPESGDGVGGDGDNDGDEDDEDDDDGEGVMRTPTGDEAVDKNRSWIGPIHPSNIHLKLCGASTVDYDVNIALETQFMVENRINSQNVHHKCPPVTSRTHLKVTSDGRQVLPARSYSNVGFVSPMARKDWIDSRFDRRTNTMKGDLKTTSFLRLLLFCLSVQINYRTTKVVTYLDHKNSDATPWTVSHTYGRRSKFPDPAEHVEYYYWDIAHDTHAEKNPRDPLEVVFSVKITPVENRNPQNLMPSAGPFINRNQTMVWVANEKLRSKGFGMIIATSLYFPSCLIRTPISTTRAAVVDLRDMSLSPPAEEREGDPNARPGKIFSLIPSFSSVLYRIKNVDVNFHDSDKTEPRGWVMGQDNWLYPIYPAPGVQTLGFAGLRGPRAT